MQFTTNDFITTPPATQGAKGDKSPNFKLRASGEQHNPGQRLFWAIMLKAVRDLISPTNDLTPFDELTARLFIEDFREVLQSHIPDSKIAALLDKGGPNG